MKRPNHAAKPATTETTAPAAPEPTAPLTLAIVDPAPALDVALGELDPERYVTARVKRANAATVDAYAERMAEGDIFPAVELFRDEAGSLWLGDGVHRVEA